jgi:hypothetical protein
MTRLQELTERGLTPDLPELGPERYLVDYLLEIGPTMPTGMGAVPLSHGEIAAWQGNVGVRLQPWEARELRRLSIEYVGTRAEAADPMCPPPYIATGSPDRRRAVSRAIGDALRGRSAPKRRGSA